MKGYSEEVFFYYFSDLSLFFVLNCQSLKTLG